MRTLVIGDIHGGLLALKQAIKRANITPEDQIIFLADYVDGWPQSAQTIQFLIDFSKTHNCIFLKGNHDEWARKWLFSGIPPVGWLENGGKSTVQSYEDEEFDLEAHRKFFNKLHNYYIDDDNRGFVHGGFVSKLGLGHDTHKSNYYWDRDLWGHAMSLDGNVFEFVPDNYKRFRSHKEVFIGHTDLQSHWGITTPTKKCNVWNLDTGGGYGGKITIMDIDSKEFWQSDFVSALYPNYDFNIND